MGRVQKQRVPDLAKMPVKVNPASKTSLQIYLSSFQDCILLEQDCYKSIRNLGGRVASHGYPSTVKTRTQATVPGCK